jgi:hypothetical protein
MKKATLLPASVWAFALLMLSACGNGVPDDVEALVTDESDFADPIFLELPPESSRDHYQKAQAGEVADCGGLIPNVVVDTRDFTGADLDEGVRGLLKENEWATFDEVTYGCNNNTTSDFIFYSDGFRNRLAERNRSEDASEGIKIPLAHRRIRSVDYTNRYEADRRGASVPVFAFTFTYTLEPDFDGFPRIEQTFEGEAKAYRDPDDGEWKMENLSLEDDGMEEYQRLLEQRR